MSIVALFVPGLWFLSIPSVCLAFRNSPARELTRRFHIASIILSAITIFALAAVVSTVISVNSFAYIRQYNKIVIPDDPTRDSSLHVVLSEILSSDEKPSAPVDSMKVDCIMFQARFCHVSAFSKNTATDSDRRNMGFFYSSKLYKMCCSSYRT